MTMDKFGRSLKSHKRYQKGPKGDGFNLTPDGNYDIQKKLLCNVGAPVKADDAATKDFVEKLTLKRTSEEDFDIGGKRLRNVQDPILPNDVVTVGYMNTLIPSVHTDHWDFSNKRLSKISSPIYDGEAVNLNTLKQLSLTVTDNHYDAKSKTIKNLNTPVDSNDAATKDFVENTCRNEYKNITSSLTNQQADMISSMINEWKPTVEKQIAENKDYNDKQLRKFGGLLFSYIHRTGRAAAKADGDFNWEEFFKTPPEQIDKEEEEDFSDDVEIIIQEDNGPGILGK